MTPEFLVHCREVGDKASYTGSHSVIRSKQPEASSLSASFATCVSCSPCSA